MLKSFQAKARNSISGGSPQKEDTSVTLNPTSTPSTIARSSSAVADTAAVLSHKRSATEPIPELLEECDDASEKTVSKKATDLSLPDEKNIQIYETNLQHFKKLKEVGI